MIEERALAGQERTCDVQRFDVPVLLLQLSFLLGLWLHQSLPLLDDETHLCGHAEVRDDEQLKLFQEGLARQLQFIARRLHEVSHSYWLDLHDVADVQIEDPLILVQKAEHSPHIDLIFQLL